MMHWLNHGSIPPFVFVIFAVADFLWKIGKDNAINKLKIKLGIYD